MSTLESQLRTRQRIRPRTVSHPPATVTVVITCFEYGHFLRQSVGSALAQEGVDVDVIIVDDASRDDSAAVAEALASRNRAVTVVVHDANRGVVESFNDGARRARGEFLVRLDADDLLTPGSLDRAVEVARAFPSVGLVYGHPLHFSGDVLPPHRSEVTGWTLWPGREWLRDRCRTGVNVITSPEVVMRRSVVESIGYQAPLRHAHDMEYWLRFAAFSDVAYVHGADQAWHREHDASLSARHVDRRVDLDERVDAFRVLFSGPAGEIPEASGLTALSRRALAREALASAQRELDHGLPDVAAFDSYRAIARRLEPGIESRRAWAHLFTAEPATRGLLGAAAPVARRIRARVRSQLAWHRWHRNGVY